MPLGGMLIAGGASLLGGLFTGAASMAAGKQAAAAEQAAAADQMAMYNNNVAVSQPFRQAGINATGLLGSYLGVNGSQAQSAAMQNYQTSPFFQQMQQNTTNQTMASFAGQGKMGGNAVNSLGQLLAGQNYGEFNTQMGQLAGLGSQGAGVTNALMGQGTQAAAQQGQLLSGAAQAQAAGIMGAGNSLGGSMNTLGLFSMLGQNASGQTTLGGQNSYGSQLAQMLGLSSPFSMLGGNAATASSIPSSAFGTASPMFPQGFSVGP